MDIELSDLRDNIIRHCAGLSTKEVIEVLANVMIALSVSKIHSALPLDEDLLHKYPKSWEACLSYLLEDSKINGESLENALGMQAITMIMWLNSNTQ